MKTTATPETAPLLPEDWRPAYWKMETHGVSWDRVKAALQRDWTQTKNDLHIDGQDLRQDLEDTLNQAAGTQPVPPPTVPTRPWKEVEPAIRYGFAARQRYAGTFDSWDDDLEHRLEKEWSEEQTGTPFRAMRSEVRLGWLAKI